VFGPEVFTVRLSYRHGLTDQLEVSAAPSMILVPGSRAGDSHGGIYAARAGLKYAPIRHISAAFGLGGGGSAAGAFLSPDFGVNVGWDNRYLVPYATARMFVSAPLAPRTVHFTVDDGAGDGTDDQDGLPDRHRRTPHFTYGFQFSTGLRAPLYYNLEQRLRPALNCAVGLTFLYDRSPKHEGFMGVGCGFDLGF
jgi:hypothetical protein